MTDKRCFSVSELSALLGSARDQRTPVREEASSGDERAEQRERDAQRLRDFPGEAVREVLGESWAEDLGETLRDQSTDWSQLPGT